MVTARYIELNTLRMAVHTSPLAVQARKARDSGDKAKSSMLRIQNIIVLNKELERIISEFGIDIPSRQRGEQDDTQKVDS